MREVFAFDAKKRLGTLLDWVEGSNEASQVELCQEDS
jgi:hypothetical protein